MIFHPEEYQAAVDYWKGRDFSYLSPEQHASILKTGKEMLQFHLRHRFLHHTISLVVCVLLFGLDGWVLLRLASLIQSEVVAGIVVGVLHGLLMYSLGVYSLHEGAAHNMIVFRKGPLSNFFAVIANNLSRLTLAESDYYAKNHLSHHRNFATPQDDEFLHFVFAKRLARVFIPYASVFNFSDFKAHAGMAYTPSRIFSLGLTFFYHGAFVFLMHRDYSWMTIVIAVVLVYPNLAFWLDRLRQYMEHNTMPLNVVNGARDLGVDFWGLLVGGGPWGQPCHWTHHLLPGLPWYNQIRLHLFIRKVLTPDQRKQFFLAPIVGFPQMLARVVKITSRKAGLETAK